MALMCQRTGMLVDPIHGETKVTDGTIVGPVQGIGARRQVSFISPIIQITIVDPRSMVLIRETEGHMVGATHGVRSDGITVIVTTIITGMRKNLEISLEAMGSSMQVAGKEKVLIAMH